MDESGAEHLEKSIEEWVGKDLYIAFFQLGTACFDMPDT